MNNRCSGRLAIALLTMATAGLLLAACGSDTNKGTSPTPTTVTTSVSATPTTAPLPRPTTTGVAAVDAAIRAVLANDAASLKAQFAYFKVNCSLNPSGGFPFPPKCASGEVDDTPVDVLLAMPGEGVYFRPSEADRELSAWLSPGMTLYAAGEYSKPFIGLPEARYWVIFLNSRGGGNELLVSTSGVVGLAFLYTAQQAESSASATGANLIPPP